MMADDVISAPCSPHPSSTESGSRRWSNSQSRRSRWRSRLLYLRPETQSHHTQLPDRLCCYSSCSRAGFPQRGRWTRHTISNATKAEEQKTAGWLLPTFHNHKLRDPLPQLWLSHLGAGTHHFCLYYYVMTFFTESAIKSQWKQENLLSLKLTYD